MRSDLVGTARRRQILDGAMTVLAESGYAGTSLNVIAERIGVSKGVISYHFAGKDALLHEVVVTVLADAEAFMTPRILDAASPLAAIRAYIEANLDFLSRHRLAIAALTEVLNGSRTAAAMFLDQRASAVSALADLLRQGQLAGELSAFNPEIAAMSLRAAIDVVGSSVVVVDLDAYAGELTRLFLHGVRA